MNTLALKLVLTPIIIGAASLAGRRWGPAVSGWLVGLPLTSAPIIFFLAVSHGVAFAADSASGTLSGGLSLVACFVAYHWLAHRFTWPISLAGSLASLLIANFILQGVIVPLAVLAPMVAVALGLGVWLISPPGEGRGVPAVELPAWDLPARVVVGTAFVLLITGVAPLLGPRLSGLVATFPLIAGTLVVFAHQQQGADAASRVLRGLLLGLFAFTGFYTVLILLLQPAGIALAFAAAIAAALLVQGVTLRVIRPLRA